MTIYKSVKDEKQNISSKNNEFHCITERTWNELIATDMS